MTEITAHDEDGVRVLAVNRPDRLNALAPSTATELEAALREAEADASIGAAVLAGVGKNFSAGGDVHAIVGAMDDPEDAAPVRLMRTFHRLIEGIWNLELPVVAAVTGVAYGGAFNLALAADLVVAAENSRFCQVFVRRGAVPDLGGAFFLPRLVGMQRAKELMLLAPEVDAAEAHRLGLVNAVAPDADAARRHAVELAGRLAAGPRFAISLTKRLVNASSGLDLGASLELEAMTQANVLRGGEARTGFGGFARRASP
ncbi:MAG: enoyl-CoA hydratase/isomerase family protein [Streptosporangiales bacterium]|nr:enoyl-CoA hydratase/isomerase family protein [Streptosporangiales bacterium]